MANGYDGLSLRELDLIFKEEFHRPEEDYEQWLIDLDSQKETGEALDESWENYLREERERQERLNDFPAKIIVDSLIGWLRGGMK